MYINKAQVLTECGTRWVQQYKVQYRPNTNLNTVAPTVSSFIPALFVPAIQQVIEIDEIPQEICS